MQAKRYLPWCTAIIAVGAMFVATGAKAVIPTQCQAGVYVINLDSKTPVTLTGDVPAVKWRYKVTASPAKIQGISEGQFVIPLPVQLANVLSGTKTDFCIADPNTKNNTGNCAGFLVRVPPISGGSGIAFFEITTSPEVAEGVITINVVGGQASNATCIGTTLVNNAAANTGIAGPADIGDPFQPLFTTQTTLVAGGKCYADLTFDTKGKLTDVQLSSNPLNVSNNCVAWSADLIINTPSGPVPLKNNTSPYGLTFGNGTSTCYGPPIPSPSKCICTKAPCP
jgi:hypothetical protein